jgi:DNA-binding CsgD family transcriptional regulator/tetratricopeptide (TPR) repeat protein
VVGSVPSVIGRADELGAVRAVADAAVAGTASALLVSGEAGVGKTALVRHVATDVTQRAGIMWASCLPLTSLAVPLLPLRSALRSFPDAPDLGTTDAVLAFDGWLDRTADRQPIVLVVDDVQWADQSSLDVLMYLLAGRADRRLGVLLTMRSGEESDGHRLRRWLADVRRFPRVGELRLGRLERVGTRDQLTVLLGRPPFESLVDDVHARSRGNPYLTSLLVRDLSPDATALPGHLPTELGDALARTWHGLSAPARRLTTILAVDGHPDRADRIAEVACSVGFVEPVLPLLHEAVDAGVLRVDPADRCWFAHPLLAEVLVEGMLPDERRALHAAFAAAAAPRRTPDGMDVDEVIGLADHYEQAGLVEPAYRWALHAAAAAEASGGAAEAIRLLRRALNLWPRINDPGVSRVELLHRLRRAAEQDSRADEEMNAVNELLTLIDPAQEPLTIASLMRTRARLRFYAGKAHADIDNMRAAERLAAQHPASPEYALVVTALARTLMWSDSPEGVGLAENAMKLARDCGSEAALAEALVTRSYARRQTGQLGGTADGLCAWEIAVRQRDFNLLIQATYAIINNLDTDFVRDWADLLHAAHEQLTALGAPHNYVADMCAHEAEVLLDLGEWRRCTAKLRVALGTRPTPVIDVRVRLTAALLASRQGRREEAEAHLIRADELFRERASFTVINFKIVRVELAVAAGNTQRAVTLAMAALADDLPPVDSELLLPLAARALADRAVACRDRREDPGPAQDDLRELRRRYPTVIVDHAQPGRWYRRRVRAMQELADAETARGLDLPGQPAQWQRAADVCHRACVAWDEAYCRWRLAEATLRDPATRREGASALREAHRLATDLQAVPILTRLETLARGARIPLAAPAAPTSDEDPAIPGLTNREREIVAYLVAGRTYGEIAKALVLSEKTVSVHVSNMLRKTGTTNRAELAQLANRLQVGT